MNKILTDSKYAKLVKDVRKLIEEGKQRALTAAHQELVDAYWQIGQRIDREGLIQNAGYGQAILKNLSEELAVDLRTLQQSVLFFKEYKTSPRVRNLKWSHYRLLLGVHDPKERRWYERLTEQQSLNRDQLAAAIRGNRYELQASKQAGSTKPRKIKLKRPNEATYVYKAFVERVIDGDTLYLRIDLGFQVFKEQRIRLAHIDCEPIDTPKGKEAYMYVQNQLARVDFIMVKTNKIDIYGRYVGDVFYSLKHSGKHKIFSTGRYLNQELVDKGLAKAV